MTPQRATASRLARRMERVRPSAIMELLKRTAAGNTISFASGLPDPALYPAAALRFIAAEILETDGQMALQYGPAEGYGPLRDWVAERLRARGLPATPEHVLITHGSQQALDLAARLFLDAGDTVLLESPSYLAAIQVFDSYEAEFCVVPLDGEGMDVEAAGRRLDANPVRLIFALPNFQNPTGLTLSRERRARLAELAAAAQLPIVEDDAYHDLRYDGEDLPPLAALAENPWSVYTGTFSKTVAPGLRVGFLYAAPGLVARLAQLKQLTDLHSGSFAQRIVYQFCTSGDLELQVRLLRETYRRRRDAMLAALARHFAGAAEWTRPKGGMFLWFTLAEGLDAGALLERAMERGVAYVPGAGFHANGGGERTLRLNFVSEDEGSIERGIAILAAAIREAR